MPILKDEEIQDLAELANDILEEGIDVSLRDGDLRNVFAAVIAANIATYSIIVGIKAIGKTVVRRRKFKKLIIVKSEEAKD